MKRLLTSTALVATGVLMSLSAIAQTASPPMAAGMGDKRKVTITYENMTAGQGFSPESS